jgi:hypothetical protein
MDAKGRRRAMSSSSTMRAACMNPRERRTNELATPR